MNWMPCGRKNIEHMMYFHWFTQFFFTLERIATCEPLPPPQL